MNGLQVLIVVCRRLLVPFVDHSHRGRSRYQCKRDNLKLSPSVGHCEEKRMRRMIVSGKERVLDRGLLLPRVRLHSKQLKDGIVRRVQGVGVQVDATVLLLATCQPLLVCLS